MAITKEIQTEYGIPFSYHKLQAVKIISDPKDGIIVQMEVASYATKEARATNKNAVITKCSISNADFALTPFYRLLKYKFEDFNGEDDFDNTFKGGGNTNPYVTYVKENNGRFDKWVETQDTKQEQTEETEQTTQISEE